MVDPVPQLNSLFGDRYLFQREIGRGRIGIVFSAEDFKYGRAVAVKALWAREAGKKAANQFLREIEIATRNSKETLPFPGHPTRRLPCLARRSHSRGWPLPRLPEE